MLLLKRESLDRCKSPFHLKLIEIAYPVTITLQGKVKDQIGQIHDEMAAKSTKSFQDIVTGIKSIKELRGALTEVEKYRNDCWHEYKKMIFEACEEDENWLLGLIG